MIFDLLPSDPIKALFWSAEPNGAVAVPIMVMIMVMVGQRKVMGRFVLSRALAAMGWIAAAEMCSVTVALFVTW